MSIYCKILFQQNPDGWITTEDWIKWASGVWDDILQIDTLDGYKAAREHDTEKHVCPLQLELIRRFVLLYTNGVSLQPDVTVLAKYRAKGCEIINFAEADIAAARPKAETGWRAATKGDALATKILDSQLAFMKALGLIA